MENAHRNRIPEMVCYLLLFVFYLYCQLEYVVDTIKMKQKRNILLWVSTNVEEPYDPQHYMVATFVVDHEKTNLTVAEPRMPTVDKDKLRSLSRPQWSIANHPVDLKNSLKSEVVPPIGNRIDRNIEENDKAPSLNLEETGKDTESTTSGDLMGSPASNKKRQNPLFVGEVEDDIPLEDPYFDHDGKLESFMETYTALHAKLMSEHSKRVVVYLPMKETGLGNSLLALSSSFFYAILTKRAFLLNYEQFTRHFTFPFKNHNSTFTFSRRPTTGFVSWNRHYNIMQPTDKSMRLLSPRMYHRTDGVIVTGFLPFLQLIIRHDNYLQKLAKMGFIDPSHIDLTKLSEEGVNEKQRESYCMDMAMEAIGVFLRKVMQPQPWIQERVDNVLNPLKPNYLIGMHIRMGKTGGTFKDTHAFLQSNEISRFSNQAEIHIKGVNKTIDQTRWVVCTDADQAENILRNRYGDVIVTSQDFHRGHSKTGAKDPDGFSRAVIDLLLLSHCDYQILTSHSTYSVIARTMRKEGALFYMTPSRGY